MKCVLAALAVALVAIVATCPAVCGDKPVPATQALPPFPKKSPDKLEGDESKKRLAGLLEQSHSVVRRQACGGELSGSGTLTSPGFPSSYANNLECVWTITAPAGQHVQLTVDQMDIENQSTCAWDQLYIRVANEPVPSILCGSGAVSGSFISAGNQMTVAFVSDASVTEQGFSATYSSVSL